MNRTTLGLFLMLVFVLGACSCQQTKEDDYQGQSQERQIKAFEFRNPRL